MKKLGLMVIPVLFAGVVGLTGCNSDAFAAEETDFGIQVQSYDISGEYTILDVETDIAAITVQTGDSAAIEVNMDKWYTIEKVVKNNTLYIREKYDGPFWRMWFSFKPVHNSVIITLPEEYVEQLNVSSDVGNIRISDSVMDAVSVDADCGNIEVSGGKAEKMELYNDNGDVTVSNLQTNLTVTLNNGKLKIMDSTLSDLDVRNDNGNVIVEDSVITVFQGNLSNGTADLTGLTTESVDICNDNGKILMELTGNQKDYNYDVTNDNGKTMIGQTRLGGIDNEFRISNDAEKDITVRSGNGNICITFLEK